MRQHCVKEYTYEGRSTANMHYEIVVYQGGTEVQRITEPTMQGAYDALGRAGYMIQD